LLQAAHAALAEDPTADVSLDSLARRLGTSTRQLERAFAEVGGTTFRAQLTDVRVRLGASLLGDPEVTIAEVAKAVGYRQPPHFAKAFRAVYGKSPSEWRRAVYGLKRANRSARIRRELLETLEAQGRLHRD